MDEEQKQHPNRATGARHGKRLLSPWRDAGQRTTKRRKKLLYQVDMGQARTAQKEGTTQAQVVRAQTKLIEKVQTNHTSAEQGQQRDADQMWIKT